VVITFRSSKPPAAAGFRELWNREPRKLSRRDRAAPAIGRPGHLSSSSPASTSAKSGELDLESESNITTWFSSAMLLFCALLLSAIGRARRRAGDLLAVIALLRYVAEELRPESGALL